ncbi:MAG: tRNA 4-thiouridine(8) synthase ThiI, partial [Clostridia bacterium]|nr:tRNA 4-thiouridine(8) synthase ThiI [Clostridia bacterium]
LHVAHFTDAQIALRDHCPPDMLTISTRRLMMRVASKLAPRRDCKVLITGESLGQVASQTLEALCTTDAVSDLPVFRPLIGLDKQNIITVAKDIGTYETSIQPYEDCCSLFVAKHPKTHPSLDDANRAEEGLDMDQMVQQVLDQIEVISL